MTIGAMLGATFSGRIADLLGRRWVCSAKPLYMSLGLYKDFRWNIFINSSVLLNFGFDCEAGNGII